MGSLTHDNPFYPFHSFLFTLPRTGGWDRGQSMFVNTVTHEAPRKNGNSSWKISKKGALVIKSIAPQWTVCSKMDQYPWSRQRGVKWSRGATSYICSLCETPCPANFWGFGSSCLHGDDWEKLRHGLKGSHPSSAVVSSWRNSDSSRKERGDRASSEMSLWEH